MNNSASKIADTETEEITLNQPSSYYDQVFYDYDCQNGKYKFITPSVVKLLGYTNRELNEIMFDNLVISQYEEYKTKYPLNGRADGPQIEEKLTVYFVETKSGEKKWIEDNSITLFDLDDHENTRMGKSKIIILKNKNGERSSSH